MERLIDWLIHRGVSIGDGKEDVVFMKRVNLWGNGE